MEYLKVRKGRGIINGPFGIIIARFVNSLVQWTPQWPGSEFSAVITKLLYGHLLKESSVSVVAGANLFLV